MLKATTNTFNYQLRRSDMFERKDQLTVAIHSAPTELPKYFVIEIYKHFRPSGTNCAEVTFRSTNKEL